MTRNEIIKLAREAGLTVGTNISGVTLVGSPSTPGIAHISIEEMQRFAALVAAAEREECVQICDAEATIDGIAQRCAAAIRARGKE